MKPKAIALLGPTASGKTGLALQLAAYLPLEIISIDSALVYRGMDIGTAKPSATERAAAPHHLIDIISPLQSYSAANFVTDCTRLCAEIQARGKLPLIVGGTMMYYQALTNGLNDLPEADENIRAQLQAEKQQYGLAHLYRRLQQADPATALRLQPADAQRIERALEVWLITGKPLSEHFADQAAYSMPLDLHTVALFPADRKQLHHQIAKRFHTMLEQGFLNEVQALQTAYPTLNPDTPAMRCVGYRQAWDYLAGRSDYDTFVERGIAATRQLAKRQLTWLRKLCADTVIDPYQTDMLPLVLRTAEQHFSQPS
ncbi:MAG: tRNA (adenosine(37)-N6)-dimethylallyltransferase MiaA [Neisseria sp.]|uniref:tRNA (adenosine(37)-N6)-dimethylallyltransferase MiaA n=1 Tax=Neisseria sp. TaxID=192066 RepID=UPI0026DAE01B|nr:tRNA (adenosine(37)-N6)-dimethylallyltransferase MiaA [Neisseria sp.]MDO4641542.1 tRNA (adenosine(37)-N6)-dimethylallyltransferase MiaA [Neisseria sp.]